MADVELKRAAEMAYREAVPDEPSGDPVLLVHGFPQSSYMWRHLIPALAMAGRRVIAPDLPGYGDSDLERPGPGSAMSRRWSASGRLSALSDSCSSTTTGEA